MSYVHPLRCYLALHYPRAPSLCRQKRRPDSAHLALARLGCGGRGVSWFGGSSDGHVPGRLASVSARSRGAIRALGAWLRQGLRALLGDHDIAAFDRRIPGLSECIRPTLPRLLAAAGRVELAPVMKGVRQILIDATVAGNGLSHVLARVAVGIQHGFGGGAQLLARLLVFGEARRRRGVRNRKIISVAGAHAKGPVAAAKLGLHRARRDSSAGIAQTAEQRFEKSL